MVLTAAEVKLKGIVHGDVPIGWRESTYDATVGCILRGGVEVDGPSFTLPPRSIVWVVSVETFKIPDDVTGLATLKTRWTHEGLLALNVGVIDPGWDGPLSTALVNFSSTDFTIKKGEPFFRILFHAHNPTTPIPLIKGMGAYRQETAQRSRLFAPTFLNMDQLTQEVSDKVLQMPRWALRLTIWGLLLAVLAIFAPITFSIWTDYSASKAKIDALEKRLDKLDEDDSGKTLQQDSQGNPAPAPQPQVSQQRDGNSQTQ